MDFDQFVEIIEAAGYEARSYSGRGMYGTYCLSVHCSDPTRFMLDIVKEVYASTGELGDILDDLYHYSTDQLGLDMIIYFPEIEWEDDETEEYSE